MLGALTFTLNYAMLYSQSVTLLDHIWSLCVEEHGYAVLAVFALLARRQLPNPPLVLLVLGAAALANGILRADLLGHDVRAVCIEPGTVRTEFAYVRTGDEDAARRFYDRPDLLEAEDIAEIVHFATSLPRRVNINALEVMSTAQAFGFLRFAGEG